jgi:hypothetical protein
MPPQIMRRTLKCSTQPPRVPLPLPRPRLPPRPPRKEGAPGSWAGGPTPPSLSIRGIPTAGAGGPSVRWSIPGTFGGSNGPTLPPIAPAPDVYAGETSFLPPRSLLGERWICALSVGTVPLLVTGGGKVAASFSFTFSLSLRGFRSPCAPTPAPLSAASK